MSKAPGGKKRERCRSGAGGGLGCARHRALGWFQMLQRLQGMDQKMDQMDQKMDQKMDQTDKIPAWIWRRGRIGCWICSTLGLFQGKAWEGRICSTPGLNSEENLGRSPGPPSRSARGDEGQGMRAGNGPSLPLDRLGKDSIFLECACLWCVHAGKLHPKLRERPKP